MPRYLLLLHESTTGMEGLGPDEIQQVIARYTAWADAMRAKGKLLGGEKLKDDAGRVMTKRAREVVVKNGPYAETREVIGGYFMLAAASYEEACELSRSCPHLELGGTIELREVEDV